MKKPKVHYRAKLGRIACGTRGLLIKETKKPKEVTCANCKHAGGLR